MSRKGIILAGGSGTRLHPITKVVSKQMLPIHDKPMIYYPLSTLLLAGIKEILIISTPRDLPMFEELLGDGSKWGIRLEYVVQEVPNGLAQAFVLGKEFIGNDPVCLVLGDNLFYGNGFSTTLREASDKAGATVFGYYVHNPEEYGVVDFDKNGKALSIEEKPTEPKSHYAVVGLYFYDNDVIEYAEKLEPSARGEYEITDLNRIYLEKGTLNVQHLGRGFAWLDTGTHAAMSEATNFMKVIEDRQGLKVACIEEIVWKLGYIDDAQLTKLGNDLGKSSYGKYLLALTR